MELSAHAEGFLQNYCFLVLVGCFWRSFAVWLEAPRIRQALKAGAVARLSRSNSHEM